MKLIAIFSVLISFIHFNYCCDLDIESLAKLLKADVQLLLDDTKALAYDINAVESYQNKQTTSPVEIRKFPIVLLYSAKVLNALLHINDGLGEYLVKSCRASKPSNINGTKVITYNVPTVQIEPYIKAASENSYALKQMVVSCLNIKRALKTYIIPYFQTNQPLRGNYYLPAKGVNGILDDVMTIDKNLALVAKQLLVARQQSSAATVPNESRIPSYGIKAVNAFIAEIITVLQDQNAYLNHVIKQLPIKDINKNVDEANVNKILKIANNLYKGITGVVKKISDIGKLLVNAAYALENTKTADKLLDIPKTTTTTTTPAPTTPAPTPPSSPFQSELSSIAQIPASLIPHVVPYADLTEYFIY